MKQRETSVGLLGFLLALTAIGSPRIDAAPAPAADQHGLDTRLSRLTQAFRENEGYLQVTPVQEVHVGYVFLNTAPSFRNHSGGWLNRVTGWPNYGTFYNSGAQFLNNMPAFRNSYGGWPNHVSGWINHGALRNGGGGGFRNGGFANGGGGFRNGGGFYNR